MPCYLITYHAYGTWLPDRPRGYVKRKVGVLASDAEMGENYRRKQWRDTIRFDSALQADLVDGARVACNLIAVRCHGIATDGTHLHVLVSWRVERSWESVSRAIKTSLTIRLNGSHGRRQWFSKGSSRKQVRDSQHFEYLLRKYLRQHRGVVWFEGTCEP
jgi:hypothetical protein